MCPIRAWMPSHHRNNPSAQLSLVSRWQKIIVKAPLTSTKMPKGVHFRFGGGSWSSPLGVVPLESHLHFSPPRVFALVDLGLGVEGDLQRFRVVLVALVDSLDVGEDRVGLRQLLQGLGLLDALEAVAQAVEDVTHTALAGQTLVAITLVDFQCLQDLAGGQVGVAAGGFDFGVGLGMRLDEGANVVGELGVFDLGARPGAGGEALEAADAGLGLVLSGGDGFAVEAKAAFGGAWTAVAEGVGDLGLEESACVPFESACRRADQLFVHFSRTAHGLPSPRMEGFLRAASVTGKPLVGGFSHSGRLTTPAEQAGQSLRFTFAGQECVSLGEFH